MIYYTKSTLTARRGHSSCSRIPQFYHHHQLNCHSHLPARFVRAETPVSVQQHSAILCTRRTCRSCLSKSRTVGLTQNSIVKLKTLNSGMFHFSVKVWSNHFPTFATQLCNYNIFLRYCKYYFGARNCSVNCCKWERQGLHKLENGFCMKWIKRCFVSALSIVSCSTKDILFIYIFVSSFERSSVLFL